MTAETLARAGGAIDEAFFIIGLAMLGIEIAKQLFERRLTRTGFFDMVASVSTQIPFLIVEALLLAAAYVGFVVLSETVVTWAMPITVWTAILAVLVCDFVYYWEHRWAHQVRLLWTQHAVHHSSRFMNITVAVRFGPFEGVWTAIMHLPLVLIGVPPELIFFGILVVLSYQTWIHTELIGRLGPLEGVLNTPANHRVHHGCDEAYIDKNYGGILIVWDRLFGTWEPEAQTPRYGLVRDFDSVNPIAVWFSELPGLVRDLAAARTWSHARRVLFAPPADVAAWREARPPAE